MLVTILGLPLKIAEKIGLGNEDNSATQWDPRKVLGCFFSLESWFKVDLSFADFSQVPTFSMIFHAGACSSFVH